MSDTTDHTPGTPFAELSDTLRAGSDMLSLDGDAVEKLAQLGARSTGATPLVIAPGIDGVPSKIPLLLLHGEHPTVQSLKPRIDEWRDRPERRTGTANVGDVDSLCALINRQKTDHSVVFANSDWTKPSLEAVVDYHDVDAVGPADHGRHRIRYDFPFSEEWKIWTQFDGKPMDQAEFAEFMEERAPDMTTLVEAEAASFARLLQVDTIAPPTRIFELARGLQINTSSKVKQDLKLQSGEAKIVFEEEHSGADGKPVTVPGAFALSIPLFYGEEPVEFPVRLRYRVRAGSIFWTYKLFRVDRIIAEAVDIAKKTVAAETGLPVYEGTPEMRGA